MAGSARAVESTPSSWRPPWLETTMPSAPVAAASRASSGSRMPLITNLRGHSERMKSMSFQVRVASKLAADQVRKSSMPAFGSSRCATLPSACGRPLIADVPEPSAGLPSACMKRRARPLQSRRRGQPGMDVAIARAGHGQVDGEEEHRASELHRPRDHLAHEAAVLGHVELEPDRPLRAGRDFPQGAAADGREA